MDVSTLLKIATSAASTGAISKTTDASQDQVTQVMAAVLPMLLSGASAQATNKETAASFNKAIADHSTTDTKDLSKFVSNVDVSDGAKIVQHLLGANTQTTTTTTAKATGVSEADVAKIMATAAPLLLSVLGQQQKKHTDGSSALLTSVLTGAAKSGISAGDVVSILGKLMG